MSNSRTFESYLLPFSLIWNEPTPHLITAIPPSFVLAILFSFPCFPLFFLLIPVPFSDAFEGLLLHTTEGAMDCIVVCLPNNNNVIKTK